MVRKFFFFFCLGNNLLFIVMYSPILSQRNSLPKMIQMRKTVKFTGDTSIFLTDVEPVRVVHRANTTLSILELWLKKNQLTRNEQETHFMITHRRQSRNQFDQDVFYGKRAFSLVNSDPFLGLYVDEDLSWARLSEYYVKVFFLNCNSYYFSLQRGLSL